MSIATAVVAVGTGATLLNATAESDRASGSTITITNPNAAALFVGGAGVTPATGFPIPASATLSLNLQPGEQVFGVLAVAGSANVLLTGI